MTPPAPPRFPIHPRILFSHLRCFCDDSPVDPSSPYLTSPIFCSSSARCTRCLHSSPSRTRCVSGGAHARSGGSLRAACSSTRGMKPSMKTRPKSSKKQIARAESTNKSTRVEPPPPPKKYNNQRGSSPIESSPSFCPPICHNSMFWLFFRFVAIDLCMRKKISGDI